MGHNLTYLSNLWLMKLDFRVSMKTSIDTFTRLTLANYAQQIKFYLKFHSRTVAADTLGLLKQ